MFVSVHQQKGKIVGILGVLAAVLYLGIHTSTNFLGQSGCNQIPTPVGPGGVCGTLDPSCIDDAGIPVFTGCEQNQCLICMEPDTGREISYGEDTTGVCAVYNKDNICKCGTPEACIPGDGCDNFCRCEQAWGRDLETNMCLQNFCNSQGVVWYCTPGPDNPNCSPQACQCREGYISGGPEKDHICEENCATSDGIPSCDVMHLANVGEQCGDIACCRQIWNSTTRGWHDITHVACDGNNVTCVDNVCQADMMTCYRCSGDTCVPDGTAPVGTCNNRSTCEMECPLPNPLGACCPPSGSTSYTSCLDNVLLTYCQNDVWDGQTFDSNAFMPSQSCSAVDCDAINASCGNGVIEGDEDCDPGGICNGGFRDGEDCDVVNDALENDGCIAYGGACELKEESGCDSDCSCESNKVATGNGCECPPDKQYWNPALQVCQPLAVCNPPLLRDPVKNICVECLTDDDCEEIPGDYDPFCGDPDTYERGPGICMVNCALDPITRGDQIECGKRINDPSKGTLICCAPDACQTAQSGDPYCALPPNPGPGPGPGQSSSSSSDDGGPGPGPGTVGPPGPGTVGPPGPGTAGPGPGVGPGPGTVGPGPGPGPGEIGGDISGPGPGPDPSSSAASISSFVSSASVGTSQSSSEPDKCGNGEIDPGEECDNGSVCSQDDYQPCANDAQCNLCMFVGITDVLRCGGVETGDLCSSHAECADGDNTCDYDVLIDPTCTKDCKRVTSSSSSEVEESSASSEETFSSVTFSSEISEFSSKASSENQFSSETQSSLIAFSSTAFSSTISVDDDDDDGNQFSSRVSSVRQFKSSARSTIIAQRSSQADSFGRPGVCGNRRIERLEQCDDGNRINGDGCSASCAIEDNVFGDIFPRPQSCGNGNLERLEQCDDGNRVSGDGCSALCALEDGIVVTRPTLVAAAVTCGNGILESPEECDDSNARDGDGCSSTCLLEIGICGDGVVQTLLGEQCEGGDSCKNCRFVNISCGNGIVDPREECDRGALNSTSPDAECRPDCSLSRCGDGILDSTEECDDGNRINGDDCDRFCTVEESDETGVTVIASDTNIEFPSAPAQVASAFQQQQFQFPQYPSFQRVPYQLPLAQLQPLIQAQGPVGDTGPAAVAVIGAGAAAGLSWIRRKRK